MITPHLLFFFFNAGGGGGGTVAAYDFMADTPSSMAAWTAARGGAGGTGEATYFDSGGNLQVASAGQWRITHDPATGQRLGLLLEPGRTNFIRNPRMEGAVAGSPGAMPSNGWSTSFFGGLSREVVGVGVSDGIPYLAIRIFGTATSGSFSRVTFTSPFTNFPSVTTSTASTLSMFVRVAAGDLTNISNVRVGLQGRDSGGTVVLGDSGLFNFTPSAGALRTQRQSVTWAPANPSSVYAEPFFDIIRGSTAAVDVTFWIGAPQHEIGAFATMPMLPAIGAPSGVTTRAADTGYNLVSVPSTFSMFSEQSFARFRGAASGAELRSLGVSDGTSNNRAAFRALDTATPSIDMAAFNGGVSQADFSDLAAPVNTIMRQAAGYAANDFAYSANGGAIAIDTSGTLASLDRLNIEAGEAVTHLRHLILYGSRLSNAELVALSTSGVASEIVDFIIRVRRRRRRR